MDVSLQQISKKFGKVSAVDNLNLHLEGGRLIGLLGPSGCGKSTTLFMLAGLLDPTDGHIFFGTEDVTKLPPEKRGIGLVFQNYALYPHMTVLENIMFPLTNLKVKKIEAIHRAKEMAQLVQIEELLMRKPKELSGGQQQRVAIARALVKKPRLLLLDEPLSNLDARLRIEMREEIRRIQREVGITTVFVTHDQEEALSISDKIAVMENGILQQYDPPQAIYKSPVNQFVAKFLGAPGINLANARITEGELKIGPATLRGPVSLPGEEITAGIRPEAFRIDTNGFEASVSQVEMIGKDLLVHFMLNDESFRALFDSDLSIRTGDLLRLSVKEKQILCFDRSTQKLIGQL